MECAHHLHFCLQFVISYLHCVHGWLVFIWFDDWWNGGGLDPGFAIFLGTCLGSVQHEEPFESGSGRERITSLYDRWPLIPTWRLGEQEIRRWISLDLMPEHLYELKSSWNTWPIVPRGSRKCRRDREIYKWVVLKTSYGNNVLGQDNLGGIGRGSYEGLDPCTSSC